MKACSIGLAALVGAMTSVVGIGCGGTDGRTAVATPPAVPTAEGCAWTPPEVAAAALDWAEQHAGDASFIVTDGAGGRVSGHNEDVARPLGSTYKLMVLAAYAREVEGGRLAADERVPVSEWERWHVAGTDGGAFEQARASIAPNGADTVSLDELASVMVEFSDNAATDYLLARVGRDAVVATGAELGLDGLFEGVAPVSGWLLLLSDASLGSTAAERLAMLSTMAVGERSRVAWDLGLAFGAGEGVAAADVVAAVSELTTWEQHVELGRAMPFYGSARDIAALLRLTAVDTGSSGADGAIVRRHLGWPMKHDEAADQFEYLGAKPGATAGVLAIAGVGTPCGGAWQGEQRIAVVLTEGQDQEDWTILYEHVPEMGVLPALLSDEPAGIELEQRLGAGRGGDEG